MRTLANITVNLETVRELDDARLAELGELARAESALLRKKTDTIDGEIMRRITKTEGAKRLVTPNVVVEMDQPTEYVWNVEEAMEILRPFATAEEFERCFRPAEEKPAPPPKTTVHTQVANAIAKKAGKPVEDALAEARTKKNKGNPKLTFTKQEAPAPNIDEMELP